MEIKVVFKDKKYDDVKLKGSNEDIKSITDWWIHKEDEPLYISEPLQFKFVRDDIFNIIPKRPMNFNVE